MTKSRKGFASLTPQRRKEIASMGGKAAHAEGVAHKWTKEEARIAGAIGGRRSGESKRRTNRELGLD